MSHIVAKNKTLFTEESIGSVCSTPKTTKNTSVTDVFFVYDGYIGGTNNYSLRHRSSYPIKTS